LSYVKFDIDQFIVIRPDVENFFSDPTRAKLYLLTLFGYFLSESLTIWPNEFLLASDKCDVYAVDNFSVLLISDIATENK